MINRVGFATPNYSQNRTAFQGWFSKNKKEPPKPLTPEEIAGKFKKVELEGGAIQDFSNEAEIRHANSDDLKKAADIMQKDYPYHANYLRKLAKLKKQ